MFLVMETVVVSGPTMLLFPVSVSLLTRFPVTHFQLSEKYGLPVEKITKLYKKSKKG